tara:strand:- start:502 stop:1032 length:531 start_codon:yes stop_codon:yes gene_type:complete
MTTLDAYTIYMQLGLTSDKAKLAASQSAFETMYNGKTWSSPVFLQNNNTGGIMYINKPFQKNATQGSPYPKSEWSNPSTPAYYAKFNTIKDSFIDHIRITYKALIKSNTPIEYANNLKAQGYYTGNAGDYAKNINFVYNILASNIEKKKPNNMMASANLLIKVIAVGLVITTLFKK